MRLAEGEWAVAENARLYRVEIYYLVDSRRPHCDILLSMALLTLAEATSDKGLLGLWRQHATR